MKQDRKQLYVLKGVLFTLIDNVPCTRPQKAFIRAYCKMMPLNIVALTGETATQIINECLAVGMRAVHHKPISKLELGVLLQRYYFPIRKAIVQKRKPVRRNSKQFAYSAFGSCESKRQKRKSPNNFFSRPNLANSGSFQLMNQQN